jgi:hypothetical protein
MYPLAPGRAELLLASPLFPEIIVHRGNGTTITVNAPNASAGTFYVQNLTLNGTAWTKPWLPESFVTNGGTLNYTLGTAANPSWGSAPADTPPSFDTAAGPTNLALNKPATGSTACNADEGPAKAVNGSVSGGTADKWCSTASTKFLQVDLGSPTTVRSFTVRHAGAGGESATWNTRDYDLQLSTDATTWTTVAQIRGNTAAVTTHPIPATTARHLRLAIITPTQNGNGAARVYEFEAYA